MKHIIIIFLMIASLVQAQAVKNELSIYAKTSSTQVELKWFMNKYSSKYEYRIFRAEDGGKTAYLATVKPASYEVLKNRAYSEDNIFMIYPQRHIKTFEDRIRYIKTEQTTDAFRILWMMKDKQFSKNIGQYYIDKTVKKDTKYSYFVGAYLDAKRVMTKKISLYTSDSNYKNDFRWVNAKSSYESVDLSWSVQDEFNYYNVYRKLSNEKEFKKINRDLLFRSKSYALKAKVLYKDKGLKEGEKASYFIRKVDMFSQEGPASQKMVSQLKVVSKAPKVVKNIFVNSTDKKITLRWRKNANTLSYDVYRSTISAGNFVKINKKSIKKEFYLDKNFIAGKEYYYYVVANNIYGNSKPSMIMLAYARDTTPPTRPTKLTYKLKGSDINLRWKDVKDDSFKGYKLYISIDQYAKEWSLLNKKPIKKAAFTHKRSEKLSANYYHYRVTALDANSNESDYSNIVSVKLPDVTPPFQPTITRTKVYSQKIILEWNKVIVEDLSHYNIYRKNSKGITKLNKKALYKNFFEYNNPKVGEYEYIVTAVDKSKNESLRVKSRTLQTTDKIPVTISKLKAKKTKKGLTISFSCKDKDYNGFELFRSSGGDKRYYNISNFKTKKSFEDKNIDAKKDYFYKVKAYDKVGNVRESRVLHYKATK